MALSKESATQKARADLSTRLGVAADDIALDRVDDVEFPDMALGAGVAGEMSAQMITKGWRITLRARNQQFEYRANPSQVRLYGYQGRNHKV